MEMVKCTKQDSNGGLLLMKDFYEAIADDARIGIPHICLYIALMHEQFISTLEDHVEINRHTLMNKAKISRKTYSKCMKELQEYGYIKYEPSSNPSKGSKVYLRSL